MFGLFIYALIDSKNDNLLKVEICAEKKKLARAQVTRSGRKLKK